VLDTPRLYSVSQNRASIAILDGRQSIRLGIGGHQRRQLATATRLAEADLICDRKGRWRLLVCAPYRDPEPVSTDGVLGVDLGRRDIAHTSDGESLSGEQVTAIRDRPARARASLQQRASKGARSTRRRAGGGETVVGARATFLAGREPCGQPAHRPGGAHRPR